MTRGALVALVLLLVAAARTARDRRRARPFAPTRVPADAFPRGERAPLSALYFTSRLCAACRETPGLVRAVDPALPLVAIAVEDRPDVVRALDVRETPTLLLVDREGRVRYARVGNPEPDELRRALSDERAGSAKG